MHSLNVSKFPHAMQHSICTVYNAPHLLDRVASLELYGGFAQGRDFRPAGITSLICEFAGLSGVVSLHGGLPPDAAFPITGATLQLADGGSISLDDPALVCSLQGLPFGVGRPIIPYRLASACFLTSAFSCHRHS